MKEFRLHLPVPPSVNAAYINLPRRGRAKSKKYKAWESEADRWFTFQQAGRYGQLTGPCELQILVPPTRGDIDNRIKVISDYCVSRGLTADDKHHVKVSIEIDTELQRGMCVVIGREAAGTRGEKMEQVKC